MTIQEQITYLHTKFQGFDRGVIHDVDNRGNEFCETVMQNPKNPSCPLTVTVTLNGCSISVGQIENVTGSNRMTAEQACSAIKDILDDKIIFVLGYREGDDTGFGRPFYSRVFALTGGEDDMSEELDELIDTLDRPLNKFTRLFSSLKGRFVIFNYSSSINKEITRY